MPDKLPNRLVLHFDGGCDYPGGVATYGWLVCEEDPKYPLAQGSGEECRGEGATNNVAEYAALRNALSYLQGREWKGELIIKGDSKLVVNQLLDEWNCNKAHLSRFRRQCWDMLEIIATNWSAHWIPREQNECCDYLTKTAYEAATGLTAPIRVKRRKQQRATPISDLEDEFLELEDMF